MTASPPLQGFEFNVALIRSSRCSMNHRLRGAAMMTELVRPLSDEQCPIPEHTLGEMYRASPHGLAELIATVSPHLRARLALYCFRRAHLSSIGLAIAATCEKDDLTAVGGNAGSTLFERSRDPAPHRPSLAGVSPSGRKISLSTGPLCSLTSVDEEKDAMDVTR
jgi:hypothetical protein